MTPANCCGGGQGCQKEPGARLLAGTVGEGSGFQRRIHASVQVKPALPCPSLLSHSSPSLLRAAFLNQQEQGCQVPPPRPTPGLCLRQPGQRSGPQGLSSQPCSRHSPDRAWVLPSWPETSLPLLFSTVLGILGLQGPRYRTQQVPHLLGPFDCQGHEECVASPDTQWHQALHPRAGAGAAQPVMPVWAAAQK